MVVLLSLLPWMLSSSIPVHAISGGPVHGEDPVRAPVVESSQTVLDDHSSAATCGNVSCKSLDSSFVQLRPPLEAAPLLERSKSLAVNPAAVPPTVRELRREQADLAAGLARRRGDVLAGGGRAEADAAAGPAGCLLEGVDACDTGCEKEACDALLGLWSDPRHGPSQTAVQTGAVGAGVGVGGGLVAAGVLGGPVGVGVGLGVAAGVATVGTAVTWFLPDRVFHVTKLRHEDRAAEVRRLLARTRPLAEGLDLSILDDPATMQWWQMYHLWALTRCNMPVTTMATIWAKIKSPALPYCNVPIVLNVVGPAIRRGGEDRGERTAALRAILHVLEQATPSSVRLLSVKHDDGSAEPFPNPRKQILISPTAPGKYTFHVHNERNQDTPAGRHRPVEMHLDTTARANAGRWFPWWRDYHRQRQFMLPTELKALDDGTNKWRVAGITAADGGAAGDGEDHHDPCAKHGPRSLTEYASEFNPFITAEKVTRAEALLGSGPLGDTAAPGMSPHFGFFATYAESYIEDTITLEKCVAKRNAAWLRQHDFPPNAEYRLPPPYREETWYGITPGASGSFREKRERFGRKIVSILTLKCLRPEEEEEVEEPAGGGVPPPQPRQQFVRANSAPGGLDGGRTTSGTTYTGARRLHAGEEVNCLPMISLGFGFDGVVYGKALLNGISLISSGSPLVDMEMDPSKYAPSVSIYFGWNMRQLTKCGNPFELLGNCVWNKGLYEIFRKWKKGKDTWGTWFTGVTQVVFFAAIMAGIYSNIF